VKATTIGIRMLVDCSVWLMDHQQSIVGRTTLGFPSSALEGITGITNNEGFCPCTDCCGTRRSDNPIRAL
jgi:hypothetical protein